MGFERKSFYPPGFNNPPKKTSAYMHTCMGTPSAYAQSRCRRRSPSPGGRRHLTVKGLMGAKNHTEKTRTMVHNVHMIR